MGGGIPHPHPAMKPGRHRPRTHDRSPRVPQLGFVVGVLVGVRCVMPRPLVERIVDTHIHHLHHRARPLLREVDDLARLGPLVTQQRIADTAKPFHSPDHGAYKPTTKTAS